MNTNTQKSEKQSLISNLGKVWPEAKLGSVSLANLVWLAEVAQLLETKTRDMSSTLQNYRNKYSASVAYSGRASLNNGDAIAEFLDGMSPNEVLMAAERILGLEDGFLQAKYSHLNPGQQRMNGGNRLRAALKRQDIKAADLH